MSVMDAFAEFAAWFEPALGGWRYLLSPGYRTKKHDAWQYEHRGYVILDIVGGIVGVGVTLALIVILVLLLP
jgi:hypothetical protein